MNKESVMFKNSPERLLIVIDKDTELQEIFKCIEEKIRKNYEFFKGASLRLRYIGRELSEADEKYIGRLFSEVGDIDVIDIRSEIVLSKKEAGNNFRGMAYGLFDKGADRPVTDTADIVQISEGATTYYKGDLCKGQRIVYKGSVVVIGNVREGAEIMASENIIVLGSIKGTVRAGGNTLKTAVIICEELRTEDILIAGVSKTEEDFDLKLKREQKSGLFKKKRVHMKVLSLRDDAINIDALESI